MKFPANRAHGFTLIELIVVILIIAALAALLVPAASRTLDRARSAQAKNDITQIVTAVNAYYTEYGTYPVAAGGAELVNLGQSRRTAKHHRALGDGVKRLRFLRRQIFSIEEQSGPAFLVRRAVAHVIFCGHEQIAVVVRIHHETRADLMVWHQRLDRPAGEVAIHPHSHGWH